jgi:hypothetical protein
MTFHSIERLFDENFNKTIYLFDVPYISSVEFPSHRRMMR